MCTYPALRPTGRCDEQNDDRGNETMTAATKQQSRQQNDDRGNKKTTA